MNRSEKNRQHRRPRQRNQKWFNNSIHTISEQQQRAVGQHSCQAVTRRRFRRSGIFHSRYIIPLKRRSRSITKNRSGMSPNPTSLTRYQFRLLAVLALINFVNFAARQIFIPLIPMLRTQLNISDEQLGSLQTLLLIVLALGSIPSGFLADRFSRKAIIATGILLWSAATFAGGLAANFIFFLIARAVVGLGEAAYAPAAQSMISGAFPQERRAVAQAIFATGMLLG